MLFPSLGIAVAASASRTLVVTTPHFAIGATIALLLDRVILSVLSLEAADMVH